MYSKETILSRLADFFDKSPNSNIGKVITIFAEQLQELEETNHRIKEWRSISEAQGKALDQIGENIRQPRGVATDEVYRVLLNSKIARSLSTGDINTIIRVLSIALDTEPQEIRIQEKWEDPNSPEEAAISVVEVPIKRLNEVGFAPLEFGRLVQKTVSAGVRVESVQMEGTFEFGTIPMEQSREVGFSDSTSSTGGYFGSVFVPSNDQELPL